MSMNALNIQSVYEETSLHIVNKYIESMDDTCIYFSIIFTYGMEWQQHRAYVPYIFINYSSKSKVLIQKQGFYTTSIKKYKMYKQEVLHNKLLPGVTTAFFSETSLRFSMNIESLRNM